MGANCTVEQNPAVKVVIQSAPTAMSACATVSVADKDSKGMTNHRLLVAARDNDVEGIRKAISQGAYLETRRPFVMRPKPPAGSSSEMCDVSTKRKKAPKQGLTPLMYCVQNGSLAGTRLLLEAKAQVQARDEDGLRPLHFAALAGELEVSRELLEYGADRDAVDEEGRRAIDVLAADCRKSKAERLEWEAVLGRPSAVIFTEGFVEASREQQRPEEKFAYAPVCTDQAPEVASAFVDAALADPASTSPEVTHPPPDSQPSDLPNSPVPSSVSAKGRAGKEAAAMQMCLLDDAPGVAGGTSGLPAIGGGARPDGTAAPAGAGSAEVAATPPEAPAALREGPAETICLLDDLPAVAAEVEFFPLDRCADAPPGAVPKASAALADAYSADGGRSRADPSVPLVDL